MIIKRLPLLRADLDIEALKPTKIVLPYHREFSAEEFEKLKMGHLPIHGGDFLASLYEEENLLSIYWNGSSGMRCIHELLLSPTETGAKVLFAWQNPIWQGTNLSILMDELLDLISLKPLSAEDWKSQPMPEERSEVDLDERFTAREFAHLMWGIRPLTMEDKWFAYGREMRLYLHRSWTGICMYEVLFENDGKNYRASKLYMNANPAENPNQSTSPSHALHLMRGHVNGYPYQYEIVG